jgi:hypothetical protein
MSESSSPEKINVSFSELVGVIKDGLLEEDIEQFLSASGVGEWMAMTDDGLNELVTREIKKNGDLESVK